MTPGEAVDRARGIFPMSTRRHRHPRAVLLLSALLILGGWPARAADPPTTIDLATAAAGTTEVPIAAGKYTVIIHHLGPKFLFDTNQDARYKITILQETHELAPLQLPAPAAKGGVAAVNPDPCPDLVEKLTNADEAEYAGILAANKDLVSLSPQGAVAGTCKDVVAPLVSQTMQNEGTYDLQPNQTLTVTIERGAGNDHRVWKRVFDAPASQGFRTAYGFNFIPNHDHEYYAKPTAAAQPTPTPAPTSQYTLTEKTQSKSLDFAPSVFFSYPFFGRAPWEVSVTAGLGFDLSAPVVFLGPSVIINQNIQVVAGVVMQQQERLRGEYTNGQPLSENLQNDQITQKTYRPNAFFGLAFRLDSNPFKASDTKPVKVPDQPTPVPTPPKK